MKVEQRPYEFLVRWGQDGAVQGAHVAWATTILNDDGTVSEYHPGTAVPVGLDKSGFPVSSAVSAAIANGLSLASPKLADYDSKSKDHEAAVAAVATLQKEKTTLIAERDDLQAQLQKTKGDLGSKTTEAANAAKALEQSAAQLAQALATSEAAEAAAKKALDESKASAVQERTDALAAIKTAQDERDEALQAASAATQRAVAAETKLEAREKDAALVDAISAGVAAALKADRDASAPAAAAVADDTKA